MLYEAYQAHNDVLGPIRLVAETFRCLLNQPWPLFANAPFIRSASAAMELLSNAGLSHDRPDFGIRAVIIEGREVSVTEEVVASDPFSACFISARKRSVKLRRFWSSRP